MQLDIHIEKKSTKVWILQKKLIKKGQLLPIDIEEIF